MRGIAGSFRPPGSAGGTEPGNLTAFRGGVKVNIYYL
jgi:hypothetical protein